MITTTPPEVCARLCNELVERLGTTRGGVKARARADLGEVHLYGRAWAWVEDAFGPACASPVDVYAGRVFDERSFWRAHDGFLPFGQAEPEATTIESLTARESAAKAADQRAEQENYMAWLLGEHRSYGAYSRSGPEPPSV